LIKVGVSPFAQGGLDETFGLAVGARRVGAGAEMANAEFAAGGSKQLRVIAGSVVGEHAANGDAETSVISNGGAQKGYGGGGAFVGMQLTESNAGMVIDGDVQHLPADTAGFIARIAGKAMARLGDTGQFLGVEMQQVSRMRVFVANDGHGGFEIAHAAELLTAQDTADGSATQGGGLGNAYPGPALAAKHQDLSHDFARGATWRAVGARTAVQQTLAALLSVTPYLLGSGFGADLERGCSRVQRQPLDNDGSG